MFAKRRRIDLFNKDGIISIIILILIFYSCISACLVTSSTCKKRSGSREYPCNVSSIFRCTNLSIQEGYEDDS